MATPHLIVSTCGTSILTNGVDNALRQLLMKYANVKEPKEVPEAERRAIETRIAECRQTLHDADESALARVSAELNGLLCFYDGQLKAGQDHHVLLCTDTWLGEATAQMVRDVLLSKEHGAELLRVADLVTGELSRFRVALTELVRWCEQTLPDYRDTGYRIVFNLTGGFKAVQGFLQALGMLYADESVYIFEGSRELLRLPRLPIRMDAAETVRRHLQAFRRLANGLPITEADRAGIPEPLLFEIDGAAVLSEWGELVWAQTRREVYSEQVFDPPSRRLVFGEGFEKSAEGLPIDRLRLLNTRIDALARHIEKGDANLRSLDLKKLAVPQSGATHEIDAWADADVRRLYGRFANDIFILERLGPALH
jgi:putative CRISPR-associated protein (TIGR02619 family)